MVVTVRLMILDRPAMLYKRGVNTPEKIAKYLDEFISVAKSRDARYFLEGHKTLAGTLEYFLRRCGVAPVGPHPKSFPPNKMWIDYAVADMSLVEKGKLVFEEKERQKIFMSAGLLSSLNPDRLS